MRVLEPFVIAPSGDPAIKIGSAYLECDVNWTFAVRFDSGHEYIENGFNAAPQCRMQDAFASMLNFFSAWEEALAAGKDSENYDIFPPTDEQLVEWCDQNGDRISALAFELEDTRTTLIDDSEED